MVAWVLGLCLVLPILAAGAALIRATPKPPPSCPACRDGENAVEAPVAARKGFLLALRCPACKALYSAKIYEGSLKHLDEEGLRRDFGA